jgi:hypothetical protein
MPHHRRRLAPLLLAASLSAAFPPTAWAAVPIAEDDPSPACESGSFGGSFPIPEDRGQFVFPPGPGYHCWIGDNDTDPDGDPLTWSIVTPPEHGDLVLDGPTGLTAYTPDPDYSTNPGNEPGGSWISDSYVYQVSDGTGTDSATFRFWIAPFNDPPTFTAGSDVTVLEGSGPYSAPWATSISPGPAPSEATQGVTFDVLDVDEPALFEVMPAIAPNGTLTFTPASGRSGVAAVTVRATDDGGLESYSGVTPTDPPDDTSDPVTFAIEVSPRPVDTTDPTITATSESLIGQMVGTPTVRTRVAWTGIDAESGINNYHLQVSVNGGTYSTVALTSPTATSAVRSLATGATYRFRVRAKDRAGNVSPFTYWPTMTPTRLQEGTSLAAYTGPWLTAYHPGALNGKTRYTSSASRRVLVRFIGRDVGWVATRTTASGHAEVRIDGASVGIVQLDRATTSYRQLVLGRDLAAGGWHTIEIRPLGDGRVDLDALVILR